MRNYTDQEIAKFIEHAPALIQKTIRGMDTARAVAEIGQEKELHIDQIGTVAELNRNMLLGLIDPQEFLEGLTAAAIPEAAARDIISKLNKKIFIPLHQQVKEMAVESEHRSETEEKSIPPATKDLPAPAAPTKPQRIPLPIPNTSGLPPKMTLPRGVTPPGMPVQRVSAEELLLEDHEEPHINLNPMPVKTQAPKPASASVQLPGSLPPQQVPATPAVPPTTVPITPTPSAPAPAPAAPVASVTTSYTVDPYREPIDDEPAAPAVPPTVPTTSVPEAPVSSPTPPAPAPAPGA